MAPALADGFLTTGPPGKLSLSSSFFTVFNVHMAFHCHNDLYVSIQIASTILIPIGKTVMNIIVAKLVHIVTLEQIPEVSIDLLDQRIGTFIRLWIYIGDIYVAATLKTSNNLFLIFPDSFV